MRAFDWQEGKPPYGVKVQVWYPLKQTVRAGVSDGVWFRYSDCVHPMQNAIGVLDGIEQWREIKE